MTPPDAAQGVAAPHDDVEQLRRAAHGDARAFREVVRRYQARVYSVALRMLRDPAEAEDVAQEVFLAVHGALSSFRGESKPSTWIYRVTRNHCLNRLKFLSRRGRRAMQSGALGDDAALALNNAMAHGPNPGQAALQAEQARHLEDALQELPPEQRLLVVLREVEGLSYEEMASITGLPEGTIKSRLHRARAALLLALPDLVRDLP